MLARSAFVGFALVVVGACASTSSDDGALQEVTSSPGADRVAISQVSEAPQPTDAAPAVPTGGDTDEPDQFVRRDIAESPQSPFDLFFGTATSPDEMEQAAHNAAIEFADYVTSCMRQQGYEWFREPVELAPPGAYEPRTTSELLKRNGYGPSSALTAVIELLVSAGISSDPVYVERQQRESVMTEHEYLAYIDLFETCNEEGRGAHPHPGLGSRARSEVAVEIERALREIRQDPGFNAIEVEWARCMAGRGYDFQQRSDIVSDLAGQTIPIYAILQNFSGAHSSTDELEQARQRVDELRAQEEIVLTDDLNCSAEVDRDRRVAELQQELELQQLELHGDRWTLMLGAQDSPSDE